MATFARYKKKDGTLSYTGQIRIRRKGKIVHSEAFTHTKLAVVKAWAKKREAELAEPGAIEAMNQTVTVREVLSWYLEFSERAGRSKASTINFLMGQDIADLDAYRLTVDDCIAHAQSRKPAKPPTILQDFIWLRLAMNAYRVAKAVPVASQRVEDAMTLLKASRAIAEPEKRTRRPTIDELDRILAYFSRGDGRAEIPMTDIVLFALFSGRREAEICRLRREDRDGDRILVRDMKHPRGVRDTWVYLTDEAMRILDRQPEGPVYFPYNPRSVGAAFQRARNFLEIDGLRFHDLRHDCASRLFELGWDIPRVAQVTGHQSWTTLQRYVHLRDRGITDKYAGWHWRPTDRG